MIATEAELRLMLGLSGTITDEERAVLALVHPEAESQVKQHVGYDPEQQELTEYYPRFMDLGNGIQPEAAWEPNAAHTQAILKERRAIGRETLQLERLPVRKIDSLLIDYDGRFDKGPDAFPSGSEWTEGEDFWAEYVRTNYCPSGMLQTNGSWPTSPGTVKVTYTGGFTTDEFLGRSTADVDSGGVVGTKGVSASGIKRAVVLTVVNAFQTWANFKKGTRGFIPGPLKSERLGDYSYTLGGGDAAGIGAMLVALPPEAEEALEPFVNYGIKLRG